MLVYRLTKTWYLVLYIHSSILHTCGTIVIEHDIYEHSHCYFSFIFMFTWFTSAAPVNALQQIVTDGWSGSRESSGSDSVSSISESRAQARVRCSRAEDLGWGLARARMHVPGKNSWYLVPVVTDVYNNTGTKESNIRTYVYSDTM